MPNIIDLTGFLSRSFSPERVAETNNGEWAGPCPNCTGTDRFRCWPFHPSYHQKGGFYWCRQCNCSGDAIQFAMEFLGWSFPEAREYLQAKTGKRSGSIPLNEPWSPQQRPDPVVAWQQYMQRFVKKCAAHLQKMPENPLQERGLTNNSCQEFAVGWNARDGYVKAENLGLEPEYNMQTFTPKKVWFPRGIVIPYFRGGTLLSVKIRRADYGTPGDTGSKYLVIRGSSMVPHIYSRGLVRDKALIVVESELDGLLLLQEAGERTVIVALGSAQVKPDGRTHQIVDDAPVVMVSLDNDDAGDKAWAWWEATYPQAVRVNTPHGKDPGEFFVNGGDLAGWVESCLEEHYLVKAFNLSEIAGELEALQIEQDADEEQDDGPGPVLCVTTSGEADPETQPSGVIPNGYCLERYPCRFAEREDGLYCEFANAFVYKLERCPLNCWTKSPRPGGKFEDIIFLSERKETSDAQQ